MTLPTSQGAVAKVQLWRLRLARDSVNRFLGARPAMTEECAVCHCELSSRYAAGVRKKQARHVIAKELAPKGRATAAISILAAGEGLIFLGGGQRRNNLTFGNRFPGRNPETFRTCFAPIWLSFSLLTTERPCVSCKGKAAAWSSLE